MESKVFIQVDDSGKVIGKFSRPQPGLPNVFRVNADQLAGSGPFVFVDGVVALDLPTARKSAQDSVKEVYAQKLSADYVYGGNTFQADEAARANIEAGLLAVLSGKESIGWTTKDNARVTLTAAQFKELCAGLFDRGQALYVKMQAKKAQVDNMSAQDLQLFDPTAGW
jgi:hypothetical protein